MGIFVTMRMVALAAGAALVAAAAFVVARPRAPGGAPPRRRGVTAAVWTLAGLYFIFFAGVSLARHAAWATCGFDLGEYGHAVWQFAHGHPWVQTFVPADGYVNHFAPLLAAFAPGAYVFPDPAYLLVVQSFALAAAVVLVYYAARGAGGPSWPAAALAAAFALSPALHGANFYDFHLRAVGVPCALAAFCFFSRRRWGWGVVAAVIMALAEDEFALYAVPLVAWGSWVCGRKRAGLLAAALFLLYFLGAWFIFPRLTYLRPGIQFHYGGYFTLEPAAVFNAETLLPKIWYLALLLLPTAAFLAAGRGAGLTLLAPLAVPLLASTVNVYQLGWQYPLGILAFAYGVAAVGVRRLEARPPGWSRRLVGAAAAAAVAFQLAAVVLCVPGMYRPRLRETERTPYSDALATAAALVPAKAALLCDDPFAARLAHRRYCYLFWPTVQAKALPVAPDAMLLARRSHGQTNFADMVLLAGRWGLNPTALTPDYAYFTRGPARFTADDVCRVWFGRLEEWQAEVPGGEALVADPLAADGRSALAHRVLRLEPATDYIYPPGDYTFTFYLRPAGVTPAAVVINATTYAATAPDVTGTARAEVTARDDAGRFTPAAVTLRAPNSFRVSFELDSRESFYFDAAAVASPAFNAEGVFLTRRVFLAEKIKDFMARGRFPRRPGAAPRR
jgi:uncharacterized membrane protein